LCERVAGRLPFAGEYAEEVMYRIVVEAPLPLSKQGEDPAPELQAIVDRCLVKDPAGRISTARELAAALDA